MEKNGYCPAWKNMEIVSWSVGMEKKNFHT